MLVRCYCNYGLSCRAIAEMMLNRDIEVEPSTIMPLVHRYAPGLEKRLRWYQPVPDPEPKPKSVGRPRWHATPLSKMRAIRSISSE